MIDDTLYNAFGQRQVSTIFTQLNQYRVVLEVAAELSSRARTRSTDLYVAAAERRGQVPLAAFTTVAQGTTRALPINHQGQFPAVTLSFNLAPGVSLGEAVDAIDQARRRSIGLPPSIPRGLPGDGAGLPGVARERAAG